MSYGTQQMSNAQGYGQLPPGFVIDPQTGQPVYVGVQAPMAQMSQPVNPAALGAAGYGAYRGAQQFANLVNGAASTASAVSTAAPTIGAEMLPGASGAYGGYNASVPVASHISGGTVLADGTVAPPAGPGPLSQGLGAVGIGYGGYQALQGIKNKNPIQAGMGGMAAGLGANAMGLALGPVGWAAAIGAPVAGALINKAGDKDRWKTEAKRWDNLVKQGLATQEEADAAWQRAQGSRGRSKADLIAEAEATGGNVDFAGSRDEKFLKPVDIVGYADIQGKARELGMDPMELSERALMTPGAVREHNGTVTTNWDMVDLTTPMADLMKGKEETPTSEPLAPNQKPLDTEGEIGGGERTPVAKTPTEASKKFSSSLSNILARYKSKDD